MFSWIKNGFYYLLGQPVRCDGAKLPQGAETSPINEASEIKAENVSEKELSEKEPDTPVTEPLTNGGSAPETPKEEIKQNGESAAVEESPVEVAVEEKVLEVSKTESTQEPVKEEDKPEEKANGLTVEEPTPVEVKAPLAEEPNVPEVIADEKVEAAGDSEVCSEKASPEAGCVEVVPPPLPSSPPPSSLTIFAESTMAPIVDTQNVDTSLPSLIPAVNSPAETVLDKQAIEPQNISSDEKPLEPSPVPSAHEDLCEPNPVENLSPAIQNVAVVSSEKLVSSSEPSSVIEPPNSSVENTDSIPPPSDLPEIVDSDKPLVEAEIPAVEQQLPVAESATVPDEPVIEQEIPIMKSTELESPIPVSDAIIAQEDSTENVPVAEKSVEQSAIPLGENTVLIASQTESNPEVISENVESNKDELVENIASKESNLPSPIDDVPNVSNESPILQRTSSDLDVSETMPPSDSFPPPPPPESCPESMTETSASESLPPPMSEFSVPDAILNSPSSEMVELPVKEEVSVNGESLTETKEVQENGIHDPHTEVNGFIVDDSIVAGVAKVPGHPEESSIPQVKSVSEVVDVPPPTESTTTESVPSETTVAE